MFGSVLNTPLIYLNLTQEKLYICQINGSVGGTKLKPLTEKKNQLRKIDKAISCYWYSSITPENMRIFSSVFHHILHEIHLFSRNRERDRWHKMG